MSESTKNYKIVNNSDVGYTRNKTNYIFAEGFVIFSNNGGAQLAISIDDLKQNKYSVFNEKEENITDEILTSYEGETSEQLNSSAKN